MIINNFSNSLITHTLVSTQPKLEVDKTEVLMTH